MHFEEEKLDPEEGKKIPLHSGATTWTASPPATPHVQYMHSVVDLMTQFAFTLLICCNSTTFSCMAAILLYNQIRACVGKSGTMQTVCLLLT